MSNVTENSKKNKNKKKSCLQRLIGLLQVEYYDEIRKLQVWSLITLFVLALDQKTAGTPTSTSVPELIPSDLYVKTFGV